MNLLRAPTCGRRLVESLQGAGRDVSILAWEDPRWQRLQAAAEQGVDLRDRFRGTLIGGASGEESCWAVREFEVRRQAAGRGQQANTTGVRLFEGSAVREFERGGTLAPRQPGTQAR